MLDLSAYVTMAIASVAALTIVVLAGLKGFTSWLAFKHAELAAGRTLEGPTAASRIDIADLKERIRKLEAIAAGVDF